MLHFPGKADHDPAGDKDLEVPCAPQKEIDLLGDTHQSFKAVQDKEEVTVADRGRKGLPTRCRIVRPEGRCD
jgi:hypothetical protein